MSAGNNAQGTVIRLARVEVQSDGEHLAHDFSGRLNMNDAVLNSPRAKAIGITALTN